MISILFVLGLFAGMLVCLEAGFRIGRRMRATTPDFDLSLIDTAVFALLGLLLGFAFSGAMSRLDARREMIVQEANAIGTAYLRIDLLPVEAQPDMRKLFRTYLTQRLAIYDVTDSGGDPSPEMAKAEQTQLQIWNKAVAAIDPAETSTRTLVLPALNEMIDITTARTVALHTRIPGLILGLLFCVSLLSALLAGRSMAKHPARSLPHAVIYAAAIALTTYVVLDLDNPRGGLIRLDAADQILHKLLDSIQTPG